NFILGILLLFFSKGIIHFLGVPNTDQYFYPNILGAVLFGIGIALLIEHFKKTSGLTGLGLGGAVIINMCGGIVLALWLLFGHLNLPLKGKIFLWLLVFILIIVSSVEFFIYQNKRNR
ncbi:hypothetical protein ACFLTE_04670, partial [Bacteroidota bacterium]